MMRNLRTAVGAGTLVLLTAGYAISQVAYFQGWAPNYAKLADSPPVKLLALILLATIVVLGFIPDREGSGQAEATEETASKP